jgi:PAS domain-containing protein
VFVLDSDARVLLADRGVEQLTGFPRRELIGRDVASLVQRTTPEGDAGAMLERSNGTALEVEVSSCTLDGASPITVVALRVPPGGAASPVRDLVGNLVEIVAHDLNNVLTVLRAEIDLLPRNGAADGDDARLRIDEALGRARGLTQGLFAVGRVARLRDEAL